MFPLVSYIVLCAIALVFSSIFKASVIRIYRHLFSFVNEVFWIDSSHALQNYTKSVQIDTVFYFRTSSYYRCCTEGSGHNLLWAARIP